MAAHLRLPLRRFVHRHHPPPPRRQPLQLPLLTRTRLLTSSPRRLQPPMIPRRTRPLPFPPPPPPPPPPCSRIATSLPLSRRRLSLPPAPPRPSHLRVR